MHTVVPLPFSEGDWMPREYMGIFPYIIWMVVSIIFYVHPYLGKVSSLTHIFSDGLKQPTSHHIIVPGCIHTQIAPCRSHTRFFVTLTPQVFWFTD